MPGGRPTKYSKAHCEKVTKLCLLGATDREIADFFEINVDTFYEWKKKHPEFSEAVREGKLTADANVAHSLYQKAVGYEKEFIRTGKDKDGKEVEIKTTRFYPAETGAITMWLKNRRRDPGNKELDQKGIIWADKVDHEVGGPGGEPIFDSRSSIAQK